MIKKISITALVSLLVLYACELDRIPESDLSDEVFWQTDDHFRQATNYLYRASDINEAAEVNPLVADVMSDNAVAKQFSSIGNGTYLPTPDFGPWNQNYVIIRAANNILEKAKSIKFESDMSRFKAEAKFFRAYAYADLVRRYGDVPLIMKTLDTDSEELYAPRISREVVVDSIYSDLDYAAAFLPTASELNISTEYSMVTRGAALALKSRIALREGTWNKFHNNSNYNHHLQISKEASLEVIQNGEYSLFNQFGTDSSYKCLFKQSGKGAGNQEAIWVWQYGIDNDNRIRRTNYPVNTSLGEWSISRSLVDAYLLTDGLPIDKSPLYQGQQNATSEYENRDSRLISTVVIKGDIHRYDEPYVPNLTAPTGYMIKKYFDREGYNCSMDIDLMVIRYGEVLLNYAEATFELNDAINDEDLNISINLLRDRVGMLHISNAFVSANGLNMQEEIRRERRVELAMEGFRYDDLIRWKTAEVELPKAILGVRLFVAEYPGVDPSSLNLTVDSFLIIEPELNRFFDPAKNYLWPLPLDQLALNANLIQNPNW